MGKFLFLVFLLISSLSFSQNIHGEVITTGKKYSKEQLRTAISNADWCGYFHESLRFQLRFDDGAIVELFSKSELKNINISSNCFQQNLTVDSGIYKIHSGGSLVRMVRVSNTSKN